METTVRDYYDRSTRVYSRFASLYNLAAAPLFRVRDRVVALVAPRPDDLVLDVATGTGEQAAAFAQRCREVVGLDRSPQMLSVARRHHPNVRFVEGDATALPFEDGRFNVTCISFALHEMPASIREATLREMVRVTDSDGIIVVADYGFAHRRWLRPVAHALVRAYEGETYDSFMHEDLATMLGRAGAIVHDEASSLGGVAHIVVAAPSVAMRH